MDEDEVEEQVMLFWNDGNKQKSIQDLVFDGQSEDLEILTYYRLRTCCPAGVIIYVCRICCKSSYILDLQWSDGRSAAYLF